MMTGNSEAEPFWTEFLRSLTRRGLRGVKLVTSDAHAGFKTAANRVLGATAQRCRVHFLRSAMAHAGKSQRRVVSAWIGTAFAQNDAQAARQQWRAVANQLRPRVPPSHALTPSPSLPYVTPTCGTACPAPRPRIGRRGTGCGRGWGQVPRPVRCREPGHGGDTARQLVGGAPQLAAAQLLHPAPPSCRAPGQEPAGLDDRPRPSTLAGLAGPGTASAPAGLTRGGSPPPAQDTLQVAIRPSQAGVSARLRNPKRADSEPRQEGDVDGAAHARCSRDGRLRPCSRAHAMAAA